MASPELVKRADPAGGRPSEVTVTGAFGAAGFPALLIEKAAINRSALLTTQQHAERDHIELGAHDDIVKRFDPPILLSRVDAVFRRLTVMAAA